MYRQSAKFTASHLAELGLSKGAKWRLPYRFVEPEEVQPCMKKP